LVLSSDPDVRLAHSRDASGIQMLPDSVARAGDAADVVNVMQNAIATGTPVTPAGSQTSMTAASITDRGTLLSLTGMKRIVDVDPVRRLARVEPGLTIGELNRVLSESGLQFAPDPTSENDATIGGAIGCNASGARSLRYGATRRHVRGVSVVHADAETAYYSRTGIEKNTVGYAFAQDPIDWFIGSEGTLGIVVEAELALVPLPGSPIGLAVPFISTASALGFVVAARRQLDERAGREARCLEYFDREAVIMAGSASGRPWGDDEVALVYLEDDAADGSLDSALDSWLELGERHGAATGSIRVFDGAQPLRDARVMRHAVPAGMNERGESFRPHGGRKVSTDWAVPYQRLGEALGFSRDACALHGAPEPVTYGHAGNGHPHQNFLAEDKEMLGRIHAAVEDTLRRIVGIGGTVSAEHGLGKLKRDWLSLQLRPREIAAMRGLKNSLDPRGLLAPGNVL
jgi:FAD/FMN-containing dehydrogenase